MASSPFSYTAQAAAALRAFCYGTGGNLADFLDECEKQIDDDQLWASIALIAGLCGTPRPDSRRKIIDRARQLTDLGDIAAAGATITVQPEPVGVR